MRFVSTKSRTTVCWPCLTVYGVLPLVTTVTTTNSTSALFGQITLSALFGPITPACLLIHITKYTHTQDSGLTLSFTFAGYFAGSSADVLVSYKNQLLSVSGPGTGRTTTCAFVGCFVDASNDSATRIEIAVSSRDACVDVQENWIQIIDKLHGDEQSAVCSRVGHWPLVDVAKGIAQHARSERKALRTLARRDARLKEEKEIAETKAREAFEAAERKQKRDKEKAEKAALNSKKKKGTSSKAGSTAGDTSVAASVIDGGETDSVMGEQLGDPSQTDPGAVPMELSVPKGDVQVTKNHGDMAEGDETPVAEGEEEAVSPEISVDESSLKKSEGVPLTETTTAEDEIDEEDGQALDVGEPDLRPASMRYILTCSDPKQAQVFRDVLNAASAAPTKWRSIRNFRVGGVLRDDLVTPRERVVPSVDTAVDTGNRIKVDTDDTTPSKEVVPVDYGKVFNLCKEFCDSFPVVRDVCVVESVVSLGIAALVQEAKETEDETERVRVLAVKTGLKKNRDNAESEDDEHENDADLNLDTPRTPTATPKPLQKRLTDYSFEKEIKVGVQFVVEFDFFGLDFFDRLNGVEFIENGFLRDLFLENKARGTEADRTRTRHAFHLREMQWEAAIFEAFEFSQKTEREKEDAEVAEKAAGAAADDEDKRIDETSNGAEPSPPDTSSPATPVGVVGIPVLSPIQVPGVTDQTRASTPFAETETKIDGKKPFALLTTTPKTPALWRKLRTKKQILVGSGGSSVFVAGPVFTPSDSAWWCPAQPGVCATLDENRYVLGLSQIPPTAFPYKTDTSFYLSKVRVFKKPRRTARTPWTRTWCEVLWTIKPRCTKKPGTATSTHWCAWNATPRCTPRTCPSCLATLCWLGVRRRRTTRRFNPGRGGITRHLEPVGTRHIPRV